MADKDKQQSESSVADVVKEISEIKED